MVETQEQIRLLRLSATEIVDLSGWPERLVEDYLNLFDIIQAISQNVDQGVQETDDVFQKIQSLSGTTIRSMSLIKRIERESETIGLIPKLVSLINRLESKIETLQSELNDLEQLVLR